MTKYREILRLKSLGFSERNIAQSCGVSRNTIAKVLKKAVEMNLSWPLDFDMTDSALEELMFPKDKSAMNKRMPDFDYIRKELLRNGVNKKLPWIEYCEECRMNGEDPLMYSQFCYYIQKDEEKRRATMHIPRKPGEQIEVDWAGAPAQIIDPDTGEITDAWIFVGVLTYSQYAFVKAYMDEKTNNWIKAHVQMFEFFGGVTPMLVPDNCTTAVNHGRSDWYTTALNTTYHEMAEHYNLAIIPARVRKPKDKPNVEGSVGKISTWITAALRNEQFFSLTELNTAIREKLDAYNARKFQKKECSRLSLFLGEEIPLLAPLPATLFELGLYVSELSFTNDDIQRIVDEVCNKYKMRYGKSSRIWINVYHDSEDRRPTSSNWIARAIPDSSFDDYELTFNSSYRTSRMNNLNKEISIFEIMRLAEPIVKESKSFLLEIEHAHSLFENKNIMKTEYVEN